MPEGGRFAERASRVGPVLEALEQCAAELPPYFAALEHPGFRQWPRLLVAAGTLIEVYQRQMPRGRNGPAIGTALCLAGVAGRERLSRRHHSRDHAPRRGHLAPFGQAGSRGVGATVAATSATASRA